MEQNSNNHSTEMQFTKTTNQSNRKHDFYNSEKKKNKEEEQTEHKPSRGNARSPTGTGP